jgi:hypothetical protein
MKPSRMKAMRAKCRDCMNNHCDGRLDCRIVKCPLYPWMPYRKLEPDLGWIPKKREASAAVEQSDARLRSSIDSSGNLLDSAPQLFGAATTTPKETQG